MTHGTTATTMSHTSSQQYTKTKKNPYTINTFHPQYYCNHFHLTPFSDNLILTLRGPNPFCTIEKKCAVQPELAMA